MCFFLALSSLDPSTALHTRFGLFSVSRLIQHPSARPWGRVPTPLGDGRVLFTLKLHCRPQKAPRAHVQCSAPAVLLLLRSTPAAQLRRRAPWQATEGRSGAVLTPFLRNRIWCMLLCHRIFWFGRLLCWDKGNVRFGWGVRGGVLQELFHSIPSAIYAE